MVEYPKKEMYQAQDLVRIIQLLRDPQAGCPWDKVQTHQSIRMNFLEEAYEAVDAIDHDDPHLMCEELGDVMMQVAFHSCIEQEAGRFTFAQVCDGVCRKLIGRHPFLFEDGQNSDEMIKNWDALKNKEKGRTTARADLMDVPDAMPSLMRAAKLQKRASGYGFAGAKTPLARQELASSLQSLNAAIEADDSAEEALGQALFYLVQLARAVGVDPEQALQGANSRFTRRVIACEQQAAEAGKGLKALTEAERHDLWAQTESY